jgi:hypothetical protein
VSGCVGRVLSALLCPGAYNVVKTALSFNISLKVTPTYLITINICLKVTPTYLITINICLKVTPTYLITINICL